MSAVEILPEEVQEARNQPGFNIVRWLLGDKERVKRIEQNTGIKRLRISWEGRDDGTVKDFSPHLPLSLTSEDAGDTSALWSAKEMLLGAIREAMNMKARSYVWVSPDPMGRPGIFLVELDSARMGFVHGNEVGGWLIGSGGENVNKMRDACKALGAPEDFKVIVRKQGEPGVRQTHIQLRGATHQLAEEVAAMVRKLTPTEMGIGGEATEPLNKRQRLEKEKAMLSWVEPDPHDSGKVWIRMDANALQCDNAFEVYRWLIGPEGSSANQMKAALLAVDSGASLRVMKSTHDQPVSVMVRTTSPDGAEAVRKAIQQIDRSPLPKTQGTGKGAGWGWKGDYSTGQGYFGGKGDSSAGGGMYQQQQWNAPWGSGSGGRMAQGQSDWNSGAAQQADWSSGKGKDWSGGRVQLQQAQWGGGKGQDWASGGRGQPSWGGDNGWSQGQVAGGASVRVDASQQQQGIMRNSFEVWPNELGLGPEDLVKAMSMLIGTRGANSKWFSEQSGARANVAIDQQKGCIVVTGRATDEYNLRELERIVRRFCHEETQKNWAAGGKGKGSQGRQGQSSNYYSQKGADTGKGTGGMKRDYGASGNGGAPYYPYTDQQGQFGADGDQQMGGGMMQSSAASVFPSVQEPQAGLTLPLQQQYAPGDELPVTQELAMAVRGVHQILLDYNTKQFKKTGQLEAAYFVKYDEDLDYKALTQHLLPPGTEPGLLPFCQLFPGVFNVIIQGNAANILPRDNPAFPQPNVASQQQQPVEGVFVPTNSY